MIEDAIVREIHDFRKAHAARFNYKLSAIVADLKKGTPVRSPNRLYSHNTMCNKDRNLTCRKSGQINSTPSEHPLGAEAIKDTRE
jgi:hypothetical protein